ncbi:MAG: sugar phosphate isomerase/epimerase [Chloroflexi bacterium]|nr:sugar phosphate isomerase/epimerase [Chloroflexota bacterium]
MKLSCLPVSFFSDIVEGRMSVGEWAQMGADLGLDGIDISILFVTDRSTEALISLRQEIERSGLGLVMVTSYPDFTHPDPAQRERELAMEQEVVSVSAALGAQYVRVTAGQAHPETSREDGIEWAVDGLRRLVDTMQGQGVTLVYENHGKPGAWTYTDFSQPPDIFLEIARRTEDVGLRINFDTANAAAFSDDPVCLLRQVVDRVETVHAADTAIRGELQHVLLGTGVAPYLDLFGVLKAAGWDGWICMEENARQGREGVERAAAFVRTAWTEAAPVSR